MFTSNQVIHLLFGLIQNQNQYEYHELPMIAAKWKRTFTEDIFFWILFWNQDPNLKMFQKTSQ